MTKKINFGAGPAKLPEAVMEKAHREFHLYEDTGISILEMSHRSAEFTKIVQQTEQLLRDEMSIPTNFGVIFMQGGGTGQFAAVPLNISREKDSADYAVTGAWSNKAAEEATRYIAVNKVFEPRKPFVTIPDYSTWNRDPKAAYLFYCSNETVHGLEYHTPPETYENVPLVADISSNFLSRPFDFNNHGVIFGGTQKNLGAAGLTVVIARNDLIGHERKSCPTILSYKTVHDNKSVYNTPPVYSIYLTKLVLEWIRDTGGVTQLFDNNQKKSQMVYSAIDNSDDFYTCPVDRDCRSYMNVPFRIKGGDAALEAEFLKGAVERGMIALKGHRSVGGIRASLYNAITLAETQVLVDWMTDFHAMHS